MLFMTHKNIIKLPIKGMHCKSCELLVEGKVKKINGVTGVDADYSKSEVKITYHDHRPDTEDLRRAISDAGYEVGSSVKLTFFSHDIDAYKDLGWAFLLLVILYFFLKGIGIENLLKIDTSSQAITVPIVLIIGMTAGFSTCMALVGGLILGLSSRHVRKHPEATAMQKFRPHIFFNLGRILGYAFFGAILGTIGSAFKLSATVNGLIIIFVGLVMLLMSLQLVEIFPRFSNFKLTLPKAVAKALGVKDDEREYSNKGAMGLGALTFFIPCGFTQAMQLYAMSSGSLINGALIMGLFALGTAPGLLTIGGLTSVVKGRFGRIFFKLAGIAVFFFAIFNISNGYTLSGLQIFDDSKNNQNNIISTDSNVTIENGVQIVHMVEDSKGYTPNHFTIKKDLPVKWIIDAQEPYSCASSMVVPKLNISKQLVAGENVIEFTPTTVGKINFSCSMGMYTGYFNIIERDGTQSNSNTVNNIPVAQASAPTAGACGAGGGCGCGGGGVRRVATTPQAVATVQDSATQDAVQVIRTTYTASDYLKPGDFKVKAGTKVKLLIDVKDSGRGCGYAIMIPGLYENAEPLVAGNTIAMEFTPTQPGTYPITCSMDMINFGSIVVE